MAGRDIQTSKRLVSPGQRDERRHGQSDISGASRPATAGRLAFHFAAGLTARGCERSGVQGTRGFPRHRLCGTASQGRPGFIEKILTLPEESSQVRTSFVVTKIVAALCDFGLVTANCVT